MGLASYRTAPPCCIVRLSGHVTVLYSYFAALPYPVTTSRSSDFGQRREPDELTEHRRPRAMGARHPRFSSPFLEGIHASRMLAQPQSQPERQDLNLHPSVYKTAAQPLCFAPQCQSFQRSVYRKLPSFGLSAAPFGHGLLSLNPCELFTGLLDNISFQIPIVKIFLILSVAAYANV